MVDFDIASVPQTGASDRKCCWLTAVCLCMFLHLLHCHLCSYGIIFHGTRDDHMEVTIQGELRRYKMLHVLDFDPTRKRMSVMVQDEDSELITWFKQ